MVRRVGDGRLTYRHRPPLQRRASRAFPLSRCPVVPLSRCPVVPLSRCPAFLLSCFPAVLLPRFPALPPASPRPFAICPDAASISLRRGCKRFRTSHE
ncbi:hypothetical protein DF046_21810 [Burkholderia cepacia]|nr:hypothetical protein DF046_21810 [Burkholderia cepacia]